jgi:type IV pilus assembly protein PilY1
MKNRTLIHFLAVAMMIFHTSAKGEDIDLFVGTEPGTTEVPNVLIILDNTGNWSSPFTNEKAALVSVFNALPEDKFRVGLMMFTETGSGNTGSDGAYVRAAIRLMTSANKTLYANMISGFDDLNDRSNSGKAGKTMAEAYYYFAGLAPYAGNNKNKTDWGTTTSFNTYNPNPPALGASLAPSRAVWAIADDATTTGSYKHAINTKAGSPYNSPIVAGCAKNFVIWISNGAAQDSNTDTSAATTLLSSAGGNTTTIPLTPSGSQTNVADEWARFMKSSLGVTTYTVDINKVTTGQGPGWTELLESMADVSGGKYFDVDSTTNAGQEISDALNDIFSEIQATNSVFASVSLPASANTQSTFLNQVFVGMFRPDGSSFPRWAGNLKQYKLGKVNNEIKLLDADDNAAINSTTGFITECARSFWTPTSIDDYWDFKESFFTDQGGCLSIAGSDGSNYPDGKIVEKGAQAYSLRSTTARTVYTCPSAFSACTTLTSFNTGNNAITEALLGASDAADRESLINWGFGLDVAEPSPNPDNYNFDDENNNSITLTEMRPSAHGDIVHSRPVAVNYGTDSSPQVVVYYGGNDGMLRAINGNRENASGSTANNIGTVEPGSEFWAFMPPEFYSKIKRIRDNIVTINYPGSTVTDAEPKPYGMDGPITTFEGEISGTDKVFIYASMRRGGRAIYAFDVTNPASPTLKWKIGCPNESNDTGCAVAPSTIGDITGIGQTWSPATSLFASGYGSGTSPMLIVGGGYDSCEDTDNGTINHSCTSSDKGRNIYVLDANTGELLKAFDTDRGVIGGITIVPDSNNLAIYAYAADLGGNVYRITMGSAAPTSWTITKIASLGCGPTAIDTCSANRKFFFAPDVVADGGTYHVIIGSGDREKPLLSYTAATTVANYFFMIKDVPSDATWLTDEITNCSDNVMCLASLTPILTSASPSDADLNATKGWYLGLSSTEQVVTSALTIADVVTFSTHIPATPDPNSCGNNLGDARVYNINFRNADGYALDGSRYGDVAGGGLSPSPVGGMVTLDNGETVPFLIGGSTDSPLEGGSPSETASWVQPKSRVYWYIEQ